MWTSIIKDLLDSGLTQHKIAELVGVAQTTISEMANGRIKEPGWSKGQALIKLHAGIFGHTVQPVQRNPVPHGGTQEDAPD